MAKAADLVGILAKQKSEISSRLTGTTAKAKGILAEQIDRSKGTVARTLLVHYIVSGLAIGAMLLILYGAFLVLSQMLAPALAAGLLGASIALLLAGGAFIFTRSHRDEPRP